MKKCSKCKSVKPFDDFHRSSVRKDGRRPYCKACEVGLAREWARNNRDKARAACKKTYHANRAKRLKSMQERRKQNPGSAYTAVKKWRKKNPGRAGVLNRVRKQRLKEVSGTLTEQEWEFKCNEYARRCAYCRKKKKLTVQHIIPISKGGPDSSSNVVPACGSCNSKIGAKIIRPGEQTW